MYVYTEFNIISIANIQNSDTKCSLILRKSNIPLLPNLPQIQKVGIGKENALGLIKCHVDTLIYVVMEMLIVYVEIDKLNYII